MTSEQIEKALKQADDIQISEGVDCYDVLFYINRLKTEKEKIREQTAKEILQRVVNICKDEEDFQDDGTVNTQLEPLYFGIANGCAIIRDEVKELAKEYGVEVEECQVKKN